MQPDLDKAREFILGNARLLDRKRFAFRFEGGTASEVVAALRPYQNADGGFGHALEPDLRCAASQPVPTEYALEVLDELDAFHPEVVHACCDWLSTVTTEEGGVPFVLSSVERGPHAPWWKATGEAWLNPTAGIAGLRLALPSQPTWPRWLDGSGPMVVGRSPGCHRAQPRPANGGQLSRSNR